MTRRELLRAGGALVAAPAFAQADDRPNIVLLMGDDHGWSETSYNNHPFVRTPVLDEMAASGLRFDRFHSAAPVCSPTRGSIITGRHPNRYGTFGANFSIRPEEISIAQILRRAGYACGHFGKWHLGPVKAGSPTNPGRMGFDEWLSHDNFFELDPHLSRNGGPPRQYKGESSEIVVKDAMRFIRQARQNRKPFFTVIWFGSPHSPYLGLSRDMALYKDAPPDLQARFAEITAMDRSIGQLRTFLQKSGLRENTLFWYYGDNGVPPEGALDMPLRGHKGQMYQGGILVPGVLEWPARIPKPVATSVHAVTTDTLPTLCDLTGQPLPSRPLDGISLRPLLEGNMQSRPSPIRFWQYVARRERDTGAKPYLSAEQQEGTTPTRTPRDGKLTRDFSNFVHPEIKPEDFAGSAALLDNRWKLVVPAAPGQAHELYDIRQDPGEARNVAPENTSAAAAMARELRDWQQSVLTSLTGADYLKP